MFDNYSLRTASRHPSQPTGPYPSVSPTSTPESYGAQHRAINDLTHQLDTSHLADQSPTTSYFDFDTPPPYNYPTNPSPTSSHAPDDPAPSQLANYFETDYRALRAQRQAASRLQCSTRHLREISALVTRMVESGEQCCLFSPSSSCAAADPAEPIDEGSEVLSGRDDGVGAPTRGGSRKLRDRKSCDLGSADGGVARSIRGKKRRPKSGSGVSKP
ncbi:hypothetical protein P152DRAFT_477245 [Eremomyces bilateralis CBS 781.70]|uniref:Uncharacterized protein n=1 Tax=Eremomyces bilateralis CBS 781.70 TaxID=1392243 RepID=A0A6G1FRI5_9PEZI|nr:uncharacterized protein P152DRAFT_477245 [Eremomyces bilateralis CBS 781.70]KAF1808455.1 hypothetical protein P152DRAFT_477245 [Eremomyces bilateralis CBS 781.70]